MRCKIFPEISFKVPRLESDVWIPIVPNIERCAPLQVRHMRLRWGCQCERGIQNGGDRGCRLSERFEAGVSGRDYGARSQFSNEDT